MKRFADVVLLQNLLLVLDRLFFHCHLLSLALGLGLAFVLGLGCALRPQLDRDLAPHRAATSGSGSCELPEPEWVHGISMESDLSEDIHTAFRSRIWMPNVAPHIELSVDYQNLSVTDQWNINIDLEGWEPANQEFMIEVNNYNGRDLHLMMLGFEPGEPNDLMIESEITTDYRPIVPQLTVFTNYNMTTSLDAVHATILDRTESTRYELLLQEIPKQLDMTASVGSTITVGMDAEDPMNTGLSLDSLMLQMNRFLSLIHI